MENGMREKVALAPQRRRQRICYQARNRFKRNLCRRASLVMCSKRPPNAFNHRWRRRLVTADADVPHAISSDDSAKVDAVFGRTWNDGGLPIAYGNSNRIEEVPLRNAPAERPQSRC